MSASIDHLTTATFAEEVNSSDTPVLVDFWAEWCGPCKTVAPVLDEIASEQVGALRIAKVNVDEQPDLARQFGVQSIPTMIVFKDGTEVSRIIGAKGKQQLLDDLAEHL
ncbi:MAG: thioredoxin [Actinomycetes bacterium]